MAKGNRVSALRQAKANNRQVKQSSQQVKLTSPKGKAETFTFRTNADGTTDVLNAKGKPMLAYKNMSYDEFINRAKMLGYK